MNPEPLAPLVPGAGILGHVRQMNRDALGFLLNARRRQGDVSRFRFANLTGVLVAHPDGIRHVLQENHKGYSKATRGFEALRDILGNGLLTSDGDFWLRQRRIAQPAFHRDRIASFAASMTAAAVDTTVRWEPLAKVGKPVDIAAEMMRLTLRIVGQTLLSTELDDDADAVGGALAVVQEDTNERVKSVINFPLSVPTPRNKRFLRARKILDDVVMRAIHERRSGEALPLPLPEGGVPNDLLHMLMAARDEDTGEAMSDVQLRDEVMTIFLAGHETTSNALSWCWYCLSKSPACERALARELETVLKGRPPTLADLPALPYTKMVLQEAMRLYPPAWLVARRAIADDAIGGFRIAKKSLVFLSPYVTQRHPAFWENPEGFDPERFRSENEAGRPKYLYFPFGGGPRICIGTAFAMLEGQLLLATIAQKYTLHLVPGHPVEPEPLITLRPRGGMPMTIHARKVGEA
jgi:cytochrome P450